MTDENRGDQPSPRDTADDPGERVGGDIAATLEKGKTLPNPSDLVPEMAPDARGEHSDTGAPRG